MIVFGKKTYLLLTEHIPDQCTFCKQKDTLFMSIFQRYVHVFWIPIVPIGKGGFSQCSHCKQLLVEKSFPGSLYLTFENVKLKTKTPWWCFIGLGLFFAFAVLGAFVGEG